MINETLPAGLAKLDKLIGNTKFICGDKLTVYDFFVAGSIMNFGLYNEYSDLAAIKPCMIEHGSD
jgi:glutathione S-transferase